MNPISGLMEGPRLKQLLLSKSAPEKQQISTAAADPNRVLGNDWHNVIRIKDNHMANQGRVKVRIRLRLRVRVRDNDTGLAVDKRPEEI